MSPKLVTMLDEKYQAIESNRANRAIVAGALRAMAESLWDVEYRINVDADSKLLLEAAELLEAP